MYIIIYYKYIIRPKPPSLSHPEQVIFFTFSLEDFVKCHI